MEKSNAAIIGMTGCGKTSASERAAELTGFMFSDTDRLLEAAYGMPVAGIYEKLGENAFRDAERRILADFFTGKNEKRNVILACGGGIVTNPRSMEILKKYCTVIRIVRDPEAIASDPEVLKRPPLCGDKQRFFDIYAARQPLYEKYADHTVSGGTAEETAERIARIIARNEERNHDMAEMNNEEILSMAEKFATGARPVKIEKLETGHINKTFIVTDEKDRRWILQRINTDIFTRPHELMENVENVTAFLRKKIAAAGGDPSRETLTVIDTNFGKNCLHLDNGYWRMYNYVEDTVTLQIVEDPEDFRKAGEAFGHFQAQLSDYPADTLHVTIPAFHDTVSRYNNLMKAVELNKSGRAGQVKDEIEFVKAHEKICHYILDGIERGDFPLRVTHNDTKLNNILMDAKTGKGLCVVDLDTVMPGSVLYDFGDAIRFGASSAAEDEPDLDKVFMRLDLFEAFTKGFIEGLGDSLNEKEVRAFPMSAMIITLEIGIRFLTDHIDGDTYFAIHREGHNLDRARTQFKLVADMETKLDEMNAIVGKLLKK